MTEATNTEQARDPQFASIRKQNRVAAPGKATKKARLITLLSQKGGADMASLSTTFGWLPHSTRAALTGLRKSGYEIASVKPETGEPARYQIVGRVSADAA